MTELLFLYLSLLLINIEGLVLSAVLCLAFVAFIGIRLYQPPLTIKQVEARIQLMNYLQGSSSVL